MIEAIAIGFLTLSFIFLAGFQLAIVAGAPLGEYSYGGQQRGVLSRNYRVASIFSALVALAIAGHYLAVAGWLDSFLSASDNQVVNWVLVGYTALSAILNNITRSKKERMLWGPITILMTIAALVVAL